MYIFISQFLTVFQLLDCFVIPVLMVLSWVFLKTRYKPVHFVAVLVCLSGVGAMVGADFLAGRQQGSSEENLICHGSSLMEIFVMNTSPRLLLLCRQ